MTKGIVEKIREANTVDVSSAVTRKNIESFFKNLQELTVEKQKYVSKTEKDNLNHLYKKAEEFGEDVPVVLLAYCVGIQQPPMIPLKICREYRKWLED